MLKIMVAAAGCVVLWTAGCGSKAIEGQAALGRAPQTVSTDLPAQLPGPLVPANSFYPMTGSKSQKVIHRSQCPEVRRLDAKDRVPFKAFSQGKGQGYKPCPICRPDQQP